MIQGAKFIGAEPLVRIGDRPVMPGEVVSHPPDVVADLIQRSDFVLVEIDSQTIEGED
jgi:hypothetical protein